MLTNALSAKAALLQLQATGMIDSVSSYLPELLNEPWTMTLVYDSEAMDLASADPGVGNYANTVISKALREFNFSVGSYTIQLFEPVSASSPEEASLLVGNFEAGGFPASP